MKQSTSALLLALLPFSALAYNSNPSSPFDAYNKFEYSTSRNPSLSPKAHDELLNHLKANAKHLHNLRARDARGGGGHSGGGLGGGSAGKGKGGDIGTVAIDNTRLGVRGFGNALQPIDPSQRPFYKRDVDEVLELLAREANADAEADLEDFELFGRDAEAFADPEAWA